MYWLLTQVEISNENKIIEYGYIPSSDFDSIESYWYAHIKLLNRLCTKSTMLVIEDYLLYGSKRDNQINSRMETPKLIGALQLHCYREHIDYIFFIVNQNNYTIFALTKNISPQKYP